MFCVLGHVPGSLWACTDFKWPSYISNCFYNFFQGNLYWLYLFADIISHIHTFKKKKKGLTDMQYTLIKSLQFDAFYACIYL